MLDIYSPEYKVGLPRPGGGGDFIRIVLETIDEIYKMIQQRYINNVLSS